MTILRYLPRFREAHRAMAVLEARESWSRADIEAFQLERLNAVWAHAVAHVSRYRDLRNKLRLPPTFRSLAEYQHAVPVLSKAMVRQMPHAFLSERAERGGWRRTSGSTGTPTAVFWGRGSLCEMHRCKYRFQSAWGVDIFDRQAFLWGNGVKAFRPGLPGLLARLRQPLEDRLRNRVRLPAYQLGPADLRIHLRRLAAFRPAALYAYSSAAGLLAREAEAANLRVPSLRVVILSAEPAYLALVQAVERAFGVPAVNEYGSSECGLLATEGPDRLLRVREDVVILETVPRDDGRHDIVVSILTNPSFPLLRYAIGDVASSPLVRPTEGFAILSGVAGRDNDLLLTQTGRPLHSVRLDYLFENTAGVRRYQARQHLDGHVSILVESLDPASPPDVTVVRNEVTRLLEGYRVEVAVVETIPPTAGGKHRWVYSDLAPRHLSEVDELTGNKLATVGA